MNPTYLLSNDKSYNSQISSQPGFFIPPAEKYSSLIKEHISKKANWNWALKLASLLFLGLNLWGHGDIIMLK